MALVNRPENRYIVNALVAEGVRRVTGAAVLQVARAVRRHGPGVLRLAARSVARKFVYRSGVTASTLEQRLGTIS